MKVAKKALSIGKKVLSTTTSGVCGTVYAAGFLTCKASSHVEGKVVSHLQDDKTYAQVRADRHRATAGGYKKAVAGIGNAVEKVKSFGQRKEDSLPAAATSGHILE